MIQARGNHITLRLIPHGLPGQPKRWRIGVPRRTVRLATARNRWKRRIREVLRRQKNLSNLPYEIHLHVHGVDPPLTYADLEMEISQLFEKLGVIT